MNTPPQPDPHQSTVSPSDRPDGPDKYRTLIDYMQQGFCIIDVLFEEKGQPLDYRFLEVNAVFEQQTGLAGVVGKTMRALQPAHEQHWFDLYAQVVRTRQPVHVEQQAAHLAGGVWYEVFAFPFGPSESHQVAILFNDITDRKQSQQHQAFLLKLSDTLRIQPNADAMANCALQGLAEQVQLDRCYIGVYRLAEDRGEFTHQVGNDRVPPVPDSVRLSDFPDALRVAFEGTLVINDVGQTAGLTDLDRQNLGALGFSALVASTLRHGERQPLWSIVAVSARPRRWTSADIKLIDEVTERTWEALERARAEEALRMSEQRTHIQKEAFQSAINDEPLASSLNTLIQMVKPQLGSDVRTAFYLAYPDGASLHAIEGAGDMPQTYTGALDGFPIGEDSFCSGYAIATGRPAITRDVFEDPLWQPYRHLAAAHTFRSCSSYPILTRDGKAIGSFALYFTHVHQATASELVLADAVTQAAAIILSRHTESLERARTDEALRDSEARLARELADSKQLQLISSRLIEADNMEMLYEQIMEAAKAIMHADTVSLQRLFADQHALQLLAWQGFHSESAHFWEWVDVTSASSCGVALAQGKRVIVPDVETEASLQGTGDLEAYRRSGLRAVQTTPLISRSGKIVGMLSNHWKTVHTPTERELGLLDVIARQAADFVERHQAGEALRQSEERFRILVQNLPDYAIFRIDPAGMITEWTEGAQRVKGYSVQEVMGQHISLFYTPEGVAAGELAQEMEQATQSGRAERESVRIRKGGERFWVNEIMTAIHDRAGRLIGFTKISRDITGAKQAQEALRDSQQRLQIVLNSIADHAIITLDPLGRITSWNQGAQQLFVYAESEAIGQSGEIIFTPEDRARGELEKEMALARGQGWAPDERDHIRQDNSRLYLSGVMSPLYDADEQLLGYVKVARDLTERRRMEQALREADGRKDEFLAMLAHELRNPMSTIRSGLQILSLTAGDPETMLSTVVMINRQTDHLVRLVDDLLDVSRISRGKIELQKQRVNVVDIVRQTAQAIEPLYQPQDRRLTVGLPAAGIYVDGDATRLAQVVTNLLTNGLRYTRPGGQVWLSLAHRAGEAILEVRDNGIGLVKDQLSTIFELFVQVDNSPARSQGGLGLGLTLVKRLVELHGGRVEAQSEGLGQGSTFTVHLPTLHKAAESQPTSPERSTDQAVRQRLLVIDDNPDAAMTLSLLLKLKGFEMHTRNSGQAGLEAAESLAPRAILLDIGMPDLDGYETCRLIRQQSWGRAMIIIALTGYGQDEDRQRTQEAGFDGHLVKPVDLEVLLKLVNELLDPGNQIQN
ncbi:PAS domain S-box protein [Larkinella soli]|uniref:PAS domain S-box protein n=1 Tax=Larkinella soli TaxID=1770527 RepID=UPI000FFBD8E2|nr:PAS domain S-box protein [Larkinella soli]